jgi:uncharacterized protein
MAATATPRRLAASPLSRWGGGSREAALFRLAIAVIALHVVDDNYLQPESGMSAGDHLVSGLVPLAVLGLAAWGYPRLGGGLRGTVALVLGVLASSVAIEAVHYTNQVGASGDDFTGLLVIPAALLLLGLGAVTLWRTRRTNDRRAWRYTRRALLGVSGVVAVYAVLLAIGLAYVTTHVGRAVVPPDKLGVAHENVSFTTSDGLTLEGWYIPSKNGAAVISFPGRKGPQKQARLLIKHGYGVLLFDRRGEGESDGDPNGYGWTGGRDLHAAVRFLQQRSDVDPDRIGGIGLSVGGEMMIEAAAESSALKAIVSEGASSRSVRDEHANGSGWQELLGNSFATGATALFSNNLPPRSLKSLAPQISGASFFVYGERGQPAERPANTAFYAAAHEPKEIWEVPGSGHIGGTEAQPQEYERRVTAFFDRVLLPER